MEAELLSVRQLARRLEVSQAWLKAEAQAGRIPCLRAGGRFLFSLAAVHAALLERAERSEADDGK